MRGFVRCGRAVSIACIISLLVGCESKPRRLGIQGRVVVDGAPLEFGSITFVPSFGGPKASAVIEKGQYNVDAARGPLAGEMEVQVRAPRISPDRAPPTTSDEWLRLLAVAPELLPARYNSESELRATVTTAGPNEFNFDLQSK